MSGAHGVSASQNRQKSKFIGRMYNLNRDFDKIEETVKKRGEPRSPRFVCPDERPPEGKTAHSIPSNHSRKDRSNERVSGAYESGEDATSDESFRDDVASGSPQSGAARGACRNIFRRAQASTICGEKEPQALMRAPYIHVRCRDLCLAATPRLIVYILARDLREKAPKRIERK